MIGGCPGVWGRGCAWLRAHIALIQLVGVVLCLPPLIFPTYVPIWAVGGALVGLALLPVVGYGIARRAWVRTPLDWPIMIMLGLLPFNLLISPDRTLTLPHVYKMIAGVALFYGIVGVLDRYRCFTLSGWAISVLGLGLTVMVLLGTDWRIKFSRLSVSSFIPRLITPFWNPHGFNVNIVGGTLAMLLPVPIAFVLFGRRSAFRLLALISACGMGFALLLTQSRGALVALAVGVVGMLVVRNWRWLLIIAFVLGVILVWVQGSGFSAMKSTLAWLVTQQDIDWVIESAQGRFELWTRGWYMLQDFALTGVGMGTIVQVMPLLYPAFLIPPSDTLEHVHNLYLNTGAEMGFPGLIGLLSFVGGLLALCWWATRLTCRTRNADFPEWTELAWGMLGVVIVYCTHGLTDHITFYTKAYLIAWSLFGVAVGVGMAAWREGHADTDRC